MADYPTELVHTRHLFDGTEVTLRPIRATDATMEQTFTRNLSPDARHARFMGTLKELPASKLREFTDIDYQHHLALVATIRHEGAEIEIGVARYMVDADGRSCEFAIVVDDAWQGSGVAHMLMRALLDAARERGLKTMEGLVLSSNHRMLNFARNLGFHSQSAADERDMVHIVRDL